MNIDRIDPAAVAAWFEDHPDVQPLRGHFAAFSRDAAGNRTVLTGCCGLTSRVADDPQFPVATLDLGDEWDDMPLRQIAAALDLSPLYAEGFVTGWDGRLKPSHCTRSGETGHADGRAAYRATTRDRHR